MNPITIKYQGKEYCGYKSPCPEWLKKKLIETTNKCEDCGSTNDLQVHRPKRQADGGLYMAVPRNHPLSNCKILCKECHEKYNYSRKLPSFTTKKLTNKYINNI